jgi:pseudaminic acid cytidylyltransferase
MPQATKEHTKNLAIIPARGGSKRIPRKNIKPFLGKPIIAYSIEAAINSGLFDEVMVSTDDEEIARVAKKYGANVPFMRSEEAADDYATLADVVDEVKAQYVKSNIYFDNICLILSTAPFITVVNLNKAYQYMIDNEVDSVRPVAEFVYPIQRALRMNSGKVEMFYPEHQKTRSQDLEPAYHDAGQFYWMKADKALRGTNKHGVVISQLEVQDIDTEDDWKMAEVKYKSLLES